MPNCVTTQWIQKNQYIDIKNKNVFSIKRNVIVSLVHYYKTSADTHSTYTDVYIQYVRICSLQPEILKFKLKREDEKNRECERIQNKRDFRLLVRTKPRELEPNRQVYQ